MILSTSVIMPVLNGERHIAAALRSVLPQLGAADEILVIDNGSTDGTRACVAALGDSRLHLLEAATPGVAAARNVGLAAMRGDFVAFLDHDDLWPAGRHAGLFAALEARPDCVASLGRIRIRFDAEPDPVYQPLDGVISDKVLLGPFLFRAAAIRALGRFDEAMRMGEDTDFLFRLRDTGAALVTWDGDGLIYRRHATNMTRDNRAVSSAVLQNLARHLARRRGRP